MSEYGPEFDRLAGRWAVIENEHDRQHPDRGECGGVGGCSMMAAAHDLESEMVDALDAWRRGQTSSPESTAEERPDLIDRDGTRWAWLAGRYHAVGSGWAREEIEATWGPVRVSEPTGAVA